MLYKEAICIEHQIKLKKELRNNICSDFDKYQ